MELSKKSELNSLVNGEFPKTLGECSIPDNQTKRIWKWAGSLNGIAVPVIVLVAFIGIFMSMSSATDELGRLDVANAAMIFIFNWLLMAFAIGCLFIIASLVLGALGSILYNTRKSALIAQYIAVNEATNEKAKVQQ